MNTALKKNDVVTLRTTELLQNGNALSKTEDGFVVFVVGAAANETVSALIIKVTKNYAVAKTLEILQPSVDRNEDGCPFSHKCGGCVFQHITYESECTYKQNAINDAFSRIGKLDIRLCEFIPSPSEKHYRNKAIYPVGTDSNGNITTGFYARMSHRIVEHEECLIGNPRFIPIRNSVVAFLQKNGVSVYDENTEKGLVRSIYLRAGKEFNQTALTLILNGKTLVSEKLEHEFVSFINKNHPEVATILININTKASNAVLGSEWRTLFGDGYIYDTLCEKRFRITPASFWQVNNRGACKLYGKAKEYANLQKGEMLLDLYCGTGSVGICIADKDNKLFGVEITPQAVKDAAYNAEINGIDAQFICANAQNALDDERVKNLKPDVITVDPPRKGCAGTVEKIASFGAKRIVYISCDPATLARDLACFEKCGYKAQKACGVDMFARTGHCETVALLSRQINEHKMKLYSAPFEMIKSGEKTIELRLFDEKRQQVKVGDKIIFTNTTTGETLNRTVVKLHRFDSFEELYKSLPLLQCGYTVNDVDSAKPSDMEQYYSIEEQNQYGVVGIELCRHKEITDESVVLLERTDSSI